MIKPTDQVQAPPFNCRWFVTVVINRTLPVDQKLITVPVLPVATFCRFSKLTKFNPINLLECYSSVTLFTQAVICKVARVGSQNPKFHSINQKCGKFWLPNSTFFILGFIFLNIQKKDVARLSKSISSLSGNVIALFWTDLQILTIPQ